MSVIAPLQTRPHQAESCRCDECGTKAPIAHTGTIHYALPDGRLGTRQHSVCADCWGDTIGDES